MDDYDRVKEARNHMRQALDLLMLERQYDDSNSIGPLDLAIQDLANTIQKASMIGCA
ncbi:MAG: hypothetical protein KAS32_20215 [Candidatus Peribacteraceae bacterium]|nr:hypothetical protein [Candidatus Peribacteraceae bacterium]